MGNNLGSGIWLAGIHNKEVKDYIESGLSNYAKWTEYIGSNEFQDFIQKSITLGINAADNRGIDVTEYREKLNNLIEMDKEMI